MDGVQNEFTTSNNIAFSQKITLSNKPQQQLPDLAVSNITVSQTGIPGETIAVGWNLSNIGDVEATGTWNEAIYLISTTDITADGTFDFNNARSIKTITRSETILSSQQLNRSETEITIPISIAEGEYRIVVVTNAGTLAEYDTQNNNQSISSQTIRIGSVDLIPEITSLPTTTISGGNLQLKWKVSLSGSLAINRELIDRIYILDTNTPSTSDFNASNAIAEIRKIRNLAANGSYVEELTIPLPIELSGGKYLFIVTDAENTLKESNSDGDGEENNTIFQGLQINLGEYADLEVSQLTISPNTILLDRMAKTIQASWTVANKGTGAGKENKWYDRIIASIDDTVGNDDDIVLGSYLRDGSLAKGASYSRTESILLPSNITNNKYNIFLQTDADIRDGEGNIIYSVFENGLETNNTKIAADQLLIAEKPYADLVVTKINAPTSQIKKR